MVFTSCVRTHTQNRIFYGALVSSASTVKTNIVYLLQPLDGSTDIICISFFLAKFPKDLLHIYMEITQHKKREERKHKKKTPDGDGEAGGAADPKVSDSDGGHMMT